MKLHNRLFLSLSIIGLLSLLSFIHTTSTFKTETTLETKTEKESEGLSLKETETESEEFSLEKHKKKHHKSRLHTRKAHTKQIPSMALIKNDSLRNSTYQGMNMTFVRQDLNEFREQNKKWDYKILDKQFDDIYQTMLLRQTPYKTLFGDRAYMVIFLNYFKSCDANNDEVLDFNEFKGCMGNDTYLSRITPPTPNYAAQQNYTDATYFYTRIFQIMDTHNSGYLNFHAYMELRLFIFSWRKCSVVSPFIEETSWECAINIISGLKTPARTTLRNTFYMCLEISNSNNVRNIDFISFLIFGSSARLYGRINGKSDGDISKNEFNLVLDENMLPARYNQFIVNTFFKLTADHDVEDQGIDLQSFIYYDFALQLFALQNTTRKWFLSANEFVQSISNPLFNSYMMSELQAIPMTNFTQASYQMYTYHNIPNFNDEQDYLLKFVEKKESSNLKKSKLRTRSRSAQFNGFVANYPVGKIYNLASNATFSLNFTAQRIFQVIDINSDGFVDWYDYGYFYQVLYLFTKFDPFQRGKIVAGEAFEKYSDFSDFPKVSTLLKTRARRFNLIDQDIYIDVFTAMVVLRIDDIVSLYTRKTDKTTLYEIELKRIFAKTNLRFINDGVLNRCLRGMDNKNVPKYDWECAFMAGVQENINYIESASMYNTAVANNLTLANTVFYNVDPAVKSSQNLYGNPSFF